METSAQGSGPIRSLPVVAISTGETVWLKPSAPSVMDRLQSSWPSILISSVCCPLSAMCVTLLPVPTWTPSTMKTAFPSTSPARVREIWDVWEESRASDWSKPPGVSTRTLSGREL
ncbi:MAG: hypothetical protein BWX47_01195 [candidate division Hyd24-12 bacterium ADurb.Bin004]|nr:MAG: hypothetical protein BWX47_01195 [candidate division Hyd24-12 bacterium ADurb.Bin004]